MPRRNPSRRCKTKSYQDASSEEEIAAVKQKASYPKRNVKEDNKPQKNHDSEESDFMPSRRAQESSAHEEEPESDTESLVKTKKRQSAQNKSLNLKKLVQKEPLKGKKYTKSAGKASASVDSQKLAKHQQAILSSIFEAFDVDKKEKITLNDLIRVADDHGQIYTDDEAKDMLRFWQTSGTETISRGTFTELAIESKFMVPPST